MYAGTFIRKREIVLETALLASPRMLRLIVVHEIFHFVWMRLANSLRKQFADLLFHELERRAPGELGESAGVRKSLLGAQGAFSPTSQLWRDYVCESFCDTAAWLYAGVERHRSFTLAARWRRLRKSWFQAAVGNGCKY